jgi:SdpC family antimicrobial peptide
VVAIFLQAVLASGAHELAAQQFASSTPSGEVLFLGIVLGDGPIAQQFELISDYYGVDSASILERQTATLVVTLQQEIIKSVNEHDPQFFSWFQAEILSRDEIRIDHAIDHAFEVVYTAVSSRPDVIAAQADLASNPAKRAEVLAHLAAGVAGNTDQTPTQAELDQIVSVVMADAASFGPGGSGGTEASLVLVLAAVAAVVAAVTVITVFAYVSAVNIAINLVYALVFVATVAIVRKPIHPLPLTSGTLLREQLVAELAAATY